MRKLLVLAILAMAAMFFGSVATASASCAATTPSVIAFDNTSGLGHYYVKTTHSNIQLTCNATTNSHRYILFAYPELHTSVGWSRDVSQCDSFGVGVFQYLDKPPSETCTPVNGFWQDTTANWLFSPTVVNSVANKVYRMDCNDGGGTSPWTWRLTDPATCTTDGYYFTISCHNLETDIDDVRIHVHVTDLSAGTTSDAVSGGMSGGLPGGCHS